MPAADVLLHQVDGTCRHVQDGVVGKPQRQVLLAAAFALERPQTLEAGDAVGNVDDVVAFAQVQQGIDRPARANPPHRPALRVAVEYLVMADYYQVKLREGKAACDVPDGCVNG